MAVVVRKRGSSCCNSPRSVRMAIEQNLDPSACRSTRADAGGEPRHAR
jgi:hypothetical protein